MQYVFQCLKELDKAFELFSDLITPNQNLSTFVKQSKKKSNLGKFGSFGK